jgi:PASTA domain-containing protein
MTRPVLVVILALACLAPATAGADVLEYGSDLSSPANLENHHGSDTSYWNIALPGGAPTQAPADGQITIVQLKGGVLPNPRGTKDAADLAQIVHFQILREKEGGRVKVVQLSTGHQKIPLTDDQNRVTKYEPVNLCVSKGDTVAFNTIGAFEYSRVGVNGAEYQVFGRVPESNVQWYEKDNGLNEGTTIFPSPNDRAPGQELLMRTTLASGADATDICPGGYAQHIYRGMEFKDATQPTVKTKTRTVRIKGFCHGENYGGCFGKVALDATLDGVPTRLGEARVSLKNSFTDTIEIPVSPENLLKLQAAKRVEGTLTADTNDNPRADDRVKWDSVPVQQKTTTDKITLVPDKFPCVVPNVVGNSSKVGKAKLKKAGCATGKVKRKKSPKNAGKVIKQSRAAGLVLPAGTKVDLTIGTK